MTPARTMLITLVLASSMLAPAPGLSQGPGPVCDACPMILVTHSAFSARERELIGEGAARARDFFHQHGIELKETIHIEKRFADRRDRLPHIGSYSLEDRTVRILGLEQALDQVADNSVFGMPIDATLYLSVVTHEIAHAIANQHFAMPRPSLVAQEYLAYAAQLTTMDPATRERILADYDVAPYENVGEMSPLFYGMAPSHFGIKVYLHFRALRQPDDFIRRLLSGDIRPRPGATE